MDCHLEAEKSSRDRQRKKLGDTLIFDEPEVSCAELHVNALKNVDVIAPKSERAQKKKYTEKRAYESEELVRHMSNLPSYLESGKFLQEKAFNVGVLDWKRLERWQKNHKQIPRRSSGYSSSSSNISCSNANADFDCKERCKDGQESSNGLSSGVLKNPTKVASFDGPIPTKENAEATKVRNPSPTRRFIIGITGKGWSSNAKDISTVLPAVKQLDAQSGQEKVDHNGRAKSSPLRRLLDPLLKPRKSTSEVDSTSRDRRSKSAPRQVESLTSYSRPMKVKLDLKGCKTIQVDNVIHRSSRMQALFQVATKNGVPLFKFAVENEGSILAATKKNDWIYSFCTIREMKKKGGNWGNNQGGKDKSRGYISSVVAQMKVSDGPLLGIKEFVLFATEIKELGQQISDVQPTDELAAIVVKLSHGSSEEFSMNVILPGGNHGLPGKGEPSPLIERWKSGGSCDCGGWDLGCKLRVLANHCEVIRESSSANIQSTAGRYELFYQGEDEENKPVFSLCPFKDGIFSVEYSSSLTLLQAFSICISISNIRKQDGIREENSSCGENSSEGTMPSDFPSKAHVEFPDKYISIPPISPVGRV